MASRPLRVLIVDDSPLFQRTLSDLLASIPGVQVVGVAANGQMALDKIPTTMPDLITLDVEMPVMNGIETLWRLKQQSSDIPVLMVSAHTKEGATVTLDALALGAFEFIAKPGGDDQEENKALLLAQLRPVITAVSTRRILQEAMRFGKSPLAPVAAIATPAPVQASPAPAKKRPDIVVIGISTGGPNALSELLPLLPERLRVPVCIVQHMPALFTSALAESLNRQSKLTVVEGADGAQLKEATVYIAPGGRQMKVIPSKLPPGAFQIAVTNDPPEHHCQPAVDYLFRSVAEHFGARALGVIMTGMGRDGTAGLRLMKDRGARVLAQEPTTCVVPSMPQEAINAGVVDQVLPIDRLAETIAAAVR